MLKMTYICTQTINIFVLVWFLTVMEKVENIAE